MWQRLIRISAWLAWVPMIAGGPGAFAQSIQINLVNSGNTTSFGADLVPALSDGQIVFNGPAGTVYTENADGTNLTQVINTSTPIPGGVPQGQTATFDQYFGSQELIGAGNVVLVGTDSSSSGGSSGYGLYSVPASGGAVTLLANEATTVSGNLIGDHYFVNGSNGFPIGAMSVSGAGQVAFQVAQQTYTVAATGGPVTCVATYYCNDSPAGETLFGPPSISGSTVALAAGNVDGTAIVVTTPLPSDPTSFKTVASGTTFDPSSLNDNPVQDGTTTVFAAQNTNDTVGGIFASNGSGTVTPLVTTNTAIPGGTGDFVWTNGLGDQSIVASNGTVAFYGAGANGANAGLYEVADSGGPVTPIVTAGQQIGQGTVSSAGMGREALSGNKLVFTATFNCSLASCPMGGNSSIFEANLVPTTTVSGMPGGSIASPTLLPVGNQQIGAVQTQIGTTESSLYEYAWSGGWFTSDAEINNALAGSSFNFDLFNTSGQLLAQELLDGANSFQATIALNLVVGDYVTGFVCPTGGIGCPDPTGNINFDTPVGGVNAGPVAAPEPGSLALLASGVLALALVGAVRPGACRRRV